MNTLVEQVYETLTGQALAQYAVPGIEDVFAGDSECAILYDQVLAAYDRLRERLGIANEDPDIEMIIGNLMRIEKTIAYKMFDYGSRCHKR